LNKCIIHSKFTRHMMTPYVAPQLRQEGATGSAGKKL
jgi:hypothetical protein